MTDVLKIREDLPVDTIVFQNRSDDPAGPVMVLTIHCDGRLEFGEHVHPKEAVDTIMEIWNKAVEDGRMSGIRE